jgi:hypothetical protein
MWEDRSLSANEIQHGGNHYKAFKIQPWDFILANDVPYMEATAVVYILRWRRKNGVEDLKKAIHYLEKLIEEEEARTVEVERLDKMIREQR